MNFEPRIELHFDEKGCQDFLWLLNFKATRSELRRRNVKGLLGGIAQCQRALIRGVDTWLDSGLRPDGAECPAERGMKDELRSMQPIDELLEVVTVKFKDGGLFLSLSRYWDKDPEKAASYLLAMMFACDWRARLAKCRRCGKYFFLHKRILVRGSKQLWKNGCCCSVEHNSSLTTRRSVKAKRDGRREEKHEWAAAELLSRGRERTNWNADVPLKQELVHAVNQRLLPHEVEITVKWVTQNRKQIQEKATPDLRSPDGRRHAARQA